MNNFTIEEIERRLTLNLITEITNLKDLSDEELNNLTIITKENKIVMCNYDKDLKAFKNMSSIKTNREFQGWLSYRTDYYQFKFVKRIFINN